MKLVEGGVSTAAGGIFTPADVRLLVRLAYLADVMRLDRYETWSVDDICSLTDRIAAHLPPPTDRGGALLPPTPTTSPTVPDAETA